jgi:APA family basic amino acid/polyamine antiporter
MSSPDRAGESVTYARRLGLFSATMLVIGGIIGSGVFLNPSIVAQRTGTAGLTLAVWGLGALIALVGAFVFGELGQRRPAAGGGYVYLRDAFGALPAFLYAWSLLLMTATGATAAVAVTFASYAAPLLGLSAATHIPLAVGAIALLSIVNMIGVAPGALTQNVFTVLKLAALAALIVAGLLEPSAEPLACLDCAALTPPVGTSALVLSVGTALVPVLFAYGGWQQTNFVAEELIAPERNLPRAMILGVLAVVVVYLLANVTYLQALGVQGLADSRAPAADTMQLHFGDTGRTLIAAGIAVSTFGFLNLVILVSPRVYQAMARDGLFFRSFATLHPRFRTPVVAIAFQGAWAMALVFSGSYGQLLDYVVFSDWIFFGLIASTLFVFRRREPSTPLSVRVPCYPWSVLLFLAAAIYVVAGSVASNPGNAIRGTALLALGVPVFLYWRRRTATVGAGR